jgi:hypothetical protein
LFLHKNHGLPVCASLRNPFGCSALWYAVRLTHGDSKTADKMENPAALQRNDQAPVDD